MTLNWDNLTNLGGLQCDFASQMPFMIELEKQKSSNHHDLSLFLDSNVKNNWGEATSHQFQSWRQNHDEMPLMGVFLKQLINYFNIDSDHGLIPVAMAACLLGDIECNYPYHNNNHFCEVVGIVLKLVSVHNHLEQNPELQLLQDDILLLFIATSIHDVVHDGGGNTVDGKYIQSRLEKQSLEKAKPFLTEAGIKDDDFKKIEMILLCTDVTRGNTGQSRAGIARDIYMAHQHDNLSIVNVSQGYQILLDDPKLSLMTMLLCEADIAMSSSLDYEFSKQMTRLIASETGTLEANAKTLYGFMDIICHGGFLTRASQLVLGQNFQAILLQAEQDMKENISFTKPQAKRPKKGVFL